MKVSNKLVSALLVASVLPIIGANTNVPLPLEPKRAMVEDGLVTNPLLFTVWFFLVVAAVSGIALFGVKVIKKQEQTRQKIYQKNLTSIQSHVTKFETSPEAKEYRNLPNEDARLGWMQSKYPDLATLLIETRKPQGTARVPHSPMDEFDKFLYIPPFVKGSRYSSKQDSAARDYMVTGRPYGFRNTSINKANARIEKANCEVQKALHGKKKN